MKFHDKFKRIRNLVSKFDTISLIQLCTTKLHEIENKNIADWNGWYPWNLLLLIKWSIEYGGKHYPPKQATEPKITKLMGLMNELPSENLFLNNNGIGGVQKFVRTTAFQQFWHQTKLNSWEISRQYSLFCDIPTDHPIQKDFKKRFNFSTTHFLELCLTLWVWLNKNEKNIAFTPTLLSSISKYSKDEIITFLNTISLNLTDLRVFLKNRKQRIKSPILQLTECTPLTTYPILSDQQGNYLIYSKKVFEKTIASIFYDSMKKYGGSKLSEQFATLFENYINRNIKELDINYFTEANLKKEYKNEKITDFLLPFNDCTLMIEAKAIEMRPSVQVYPENKQLERELKDSVLKAVFQGFSLAKKIHLNSDTLDIPYRSNFFLMIVTYRELYLGTGQDIWEEFLGNIVNPFLIENEIDQTLIPPENIIVLSIDDLDLLLSVAHARQDTIPNILKTMVKDNSDRATSKYSFAMHLDKYPKRDLILPTNEKVYNKIFDDLLSKIKQ